VDKVDEFRNRDAAMLLVEVIVAQLSKHDIIFETQRRQNHEHSASDL
jgi:predicted metal-dependent HD superfamily phosphohydrolase